MPSCINLNFQDLQYSFYLTYVIQQEINNFTVSMDTFNIFHLYKSVVCVCIYICISFIFIVDL